MGDLPDFILPTYTSQQGKERQAARPVVVELEFPTEVTLVSGKRRTEIGHLEGRSNKLHLSEFSNIYAPSATDNLAQVEWVLQAQTETSLQLTVKSDRAGILRRQVQLPAINV